MINKKRMTDYFLNLVRIDSLSREELEVARFLIPDLEVLGAKVRIDDAAGKIGGNVGNVIACFPGTLAGESVLLSAHMDTVVPGRGIKPVQDGKRIRTDGTTILGGDDKSGISIIMEVMRILKEKNIPHPPVEVVFTVCEEDGLVGAKHLDPDGLKSRNGLVLDSCSADSLYIRGPAADRVTFTVHGLSSHAGISPEEGISAIRVASEGIAKMKLGRVDSETTANIGLIEGGKAVNIIPDRVVVKGEARSLVEAKLDKQSAHMAECLREAAKKHSVIRDGQEIRACVEEKIVRDYPKMSLGKDAPVVSWVEAAAKALDVSVSCRDTGGGCDANVFNGFGMNIANLGTGMREIHTVNEYLILSEFYQTADVVLRMLQEST